jgi:hypothetical protein
MDITERAARWGKLPCDWRRRVMLGETKHAGVEGRSNGRADARPRIALALTALVCAIVPFTFDIALAATTSAQPPKSLRLALTTVAGLGIFILGLPTVAAAIYVAARRTWVAIGVLVLAVLPFSAFFQWQNPAIAASFGKLLAIVGTLAAVGLLSAAGVGVAKLLVKEAARIGAAATAMATALPLVLGVIAPLGGFVIARMVGSVSPEAALTLVGAPVAAGLTALAFPLAWLSRSIARTTIGTGVGFLLLSLWPVALSHAVDAGQGVLVVFLLIPLIPLAWLLARAGASLAGTPAARDLKA